jgi:hypothetical protein
MLTGVNQRLSNVGVRRQGTQDGSGFHEIRPRAYDMEDVHKQVGDSGIVYGLCRGRRLTGLCSHQTIRRATEELKVARDYDQVCRILTAAFGNNDFDAFELVRR